MAKCVKLVFLLAVAAWYEVMAADLADDVPSSSVSWICPNEPFEAAVSKSRFYRHAFTTRDGLLRATARWWIDDWGLVHVGGNKIPAAENTGETPVDLTAALAKAGRHVLAVEGKNMVGSGGVCLSIALEYADGKNETVYTSESWLCATNAPNGWTAPGFDDSAWQTVRRHGDVFSPPWCDIADMASLASPSEKAHRAAIRAARDARTEKALAAIAQEKKPRCRVVYENGKPYFDIGGRRFETAFYNCSGGWRDDNPRLRRQTALFRDAGMHIYGIGVFTPRVWRQENKKGKYAAWGGQTSWLLNAEYSVPVVKYVRVAAFTDLGSVGEDEFDFSTDYFCWSVGFGIRLDIESFPIRLDFAVPVVEPDDDVDKEFFSFTIGYDF